MTKEEGCPVGSIEEIVAWEEKYENEWLEDRPITGVDRIFKVVLAK